MKTPPPARPTPPAASLLAVACPACLGALAVGADLAAQPADCPLCGSGFLVPHFPREGAARPLQSPGPTSADDDAARQPRSRPVAPPRPAEAVRQETLAPALPADDTARQPTTARAPEADPPLEFREPVLTVGSGAEAIVLRQLSPEERAARRTRRNLVMLVGGVSILLTIVLLLGRQR